MLSHYAVVADPCRFGDPNRKATVENAIGHTQSTALKGRKFDSIDAQNTWLAHWVERWAALRIHGRKKRQVRYFKQATRTVDEAGLVQVEGSYYAPLPATPHRAVTMRIFERDIEILNVTGQVLRRHPKSRRRRLTLIAPSTNATTTQK